MPIWIRSYRKQLWDNLYTVSLCSSFTQKVFSLFDKLWIVVIFWKIYCLENNVQMLGEHVGFYIQVLMTVFWLRWIFCRYWCFFSLLIQIVSSQTNKHVVEVTLAKFEDVRMRIEAGWYRERGAHTENRRTTLIDSLQLHWTVCTLQLIKVLSSMI